MRRHATPILLALFISAGCFSEQAQEKAIWEERGYVSVGSGIGLTVPLGRIGEVMEPGWSMEVRAAYHLNLPWGGLGFGFLTGVISQTASDEASSPYNMSSVPLGVSL